MQIFLYHPCNWDFVRGLQSLDNCINVLGLNFDRYKVNGKYRDFDIFRLIFLLGIGGIVIIWDFDALRLIFFVMYIGNIVIMTLHIWSAPCH